MNDGTREFDPFSGGEIARIAPSTEPQREIIASAMMSPEANTAFNEAVSLTIRGPLDVTALERALARIVDRHDALRMTFTPSGGELCVTDENRFSLERTDIGCSDEETQERRLRALWRELVSTPMDLANGPLFRAVLASRGSETAELILLAHHVICDGWSFCILLDELSRLLSEEPRDLEPGVSFADFAERQAAESASNADIDFWLQQFKVLPPPLDLPTDRPRPVLRGFGAERTDFLFGADLAASMRAAAGRIKASQVNFALGGLAVLLHRLCGSEDFVIGLPVARQNSENLGGLVGHGVQLLPIRLQVRSDEPFSAVVARAKSAVLDAQEHPGFTFGTLVRELSLSGDGSRVPLIPIVFNIDQAMEPMSLGKARAVVRTVPRVAENFEIFLNVLPTAQALTMEATFNSGLFDEGSIRAWLDALHSILADAAADPQKPVAEIDLAAGADGAYRALNDTARAQPDGAWLEAFARQAQKFPDAPAVGDAQTQLTYAELDRRAGQLALVLRQQGVDKGDLVALHLKRSVELVVAIMAVHRAGAGYVPLDPGFPQARLEYMLKDSRAKLVLTDASSSAGPGGAAVATIALPLRAAEPAAATLPSVAADDTAYVIYTSGSTGKPKGVRVPHGAVANFLQAMSGRPGMSATDRLLAVTTLSFDISVLELLLPLACGASVYVATREECADAHSLERLLAEQAISFMQATPAMWRMLVANDWKGDRNLKALCGGEPLPLELAQKLAARVASLWNMYGPTETTIWSTCLAVAAACERITIGRPIDNTEVYVLDDDARLMPPAVPGELAIGGAGVAREYLNLPELTAERFIRHPVLGRLYRTGDRARLLTNGEIEHLGRLDQQVKVRGFRIELQEIEAVLEQHGDVDRAAVHLWQAKADDVRMVACCVPAGGRTIAPIQLRKHLRSNLPEYMIPQHFLAVESIPMTPNGKVDRRSLPVPVVTDSRIGRREAPATPGEAAIAEIWTALVRPERPIGREDRFFEIGGHSLLGLEALRQIEERMGVRLHARILFLENLAGIARQCGDGSAAGHEAAPVSRPSPLPPEARLLLSDMQEYVYNEVKASPDTLAFNIPFSFRAGSSLDVPRFEASLRDVFDRHAALRCVVREDDSGAYLATGGTDRAFHLTHHDLREEPDGPAAAMTTMIAATKDVFDVHEGPLVRMHLMRLADGEHVFLFMPHQLVFDGWSFDVFLRELDRAYVNGGRSPDPVNRIDFPDYSTWQRSSGEATAPVLEFWKGELENAPSLDWPEASASGEAPGRIQFRIPAEQVRRCEELLKPANVKLQNLLLAVFAKVVATATRRSDLTIGLAASGRYLPETATMIGPFYRNLPLGVAVPEDGGLMALAEDVQRRSDRITEHQDVPYWTLGELAGSPTALASFGRLAFSFQEARGRTLRLGDVALSQISVPRPGMVADLEFWLRNTPECLLASLDCRNGRSDEPLLQALRDDYLAMLDAVIAGGPAATSGRAAQVYEAALGRHSGEGNGRGDPSPVRPSRRAQL